MVVQSGRSIARLSQLKPQCLQLRQSLVSSSSGRVHGLVALLNAFRTTHNALGSGLYASTSVRGYASRPSRPKQHTGRTTSTRKTKAAPKKPAAASSSKAAPKAKPKAKAVTKKKAKPRAKAKPKPKPKAKPRKKVLTEEQKEAKALKDRRAKARELKAIALDPPSPGPQTITQLLLSELAHANKGVPGGAEKVQSHLKEATNRARNFTPEELETYNHKVNQAKAKAEAAYRLFINSHTPLQILEANKARAQLKQMKEKDGKTKLRKRSYGPLKDERQVKRPVTPYASYVVDRNTSNDYKGMNLPTQSQLIAKEWKAAGEAGQKPYWDRFKADAERYRQEMKTVYNIDVQDPKTKKLA